MILDMFVALSAFVIFAGLSYVNDKEIIEKGVFKEMEQRLTISKSVCDELRGFLADRIELVAELGDCASKEATVLKVLATELRRIAAERAAMAGERAAAALDADLLAAVLKLCIDHAEDVKALPIAIDCRQAEEVPNLVLALIGEIRKVAGISREHCGVLKRFIGLEDDDPDCERSVAETFQLFAARVGAGATISDGDDGPAGAKVALKRLCEDIANAAPEIFKARALDCEVAAENPTLLLVVIETMKERIGSLEEIAKGQSFSADDLYTLFDSNEAVLAKDSHENARLICGELLERARVEGPRGGMINVHGHASCEYTGQVGRSEFQKIESMSYARDLNITKYTDVEKFKLGAYFYNLRLSFLRARNFIQFCVDSASEKDRIDWVSHIAQGRFAVAALGEREGATLEMTVGNANEGCPYRTDGPFLAGRTGAALAEDRFGGLARRVDFSWTEKRIFLCPSGIEDEACRHREKATR